ncbi:MAG: hypothetical protein ACI8T1_002806 [Verrucomicrobiales bacterium]|jgi:hypothetical protein
MSHFTMRALSGWTFRFSGIFVSGTAMAASDARDLKVESPYFQVVGDDVSVDAFPLKSTNVKVVISGLIADVEVAQVYGNANASGSPIEAIYVFPGYTGNGRFLQSIEKYESC